MKLAGADALKPIFLRPLFHRLQWICRKEIGVFYVHEITRIRLGISGTIFLSILLEQYVLWIRCILTMQENLSLDESSFLAHTNYRKHGYHQRLES